VGAGYSYRGFEGSGEYAVGTGEKAGGTVESFQAINSDLRYGYIIGGYFGFAGLNDLHVWNLGVNHACPLYSKGKFEVKYYDLKSDKAAGTLGKNLGTELDLHYRVNHSENVSYGITYAQFYPGTAGTNTNGHFTPTTLYGADVQVRF